MDPDFGMKVLEQERHSDATITCQEYQFRVHCSILSVVSRYFEGAFAGGFKESLTKNIDLDWENPVLIARLVLFLYTHKYPNRAGLDSTDGTKLDKQQDWLKRKEGDVSGGDFSMDDRNDIYSLTLHAQMYVIGDRFLSKDLKDFAENCLRMTVMSLRKGVLYEEEERLVPVYEAARIIYLQTPKESENRRIRDIMVYCVQEHNQEQSLTRARLQELFTETPEFAADLVTSGQARQTVYCRECNKNVSLRGLKCMCGLTGVCRKDSFCRASLHQRFGVRNVKCWECNGEGTLCWPQPRLNWR